MLEFLCVLSVVLVTKQNKKSVYKSPQDSTPKKKKNTVYEFFKYLKKFLVISTPSVGLKLSHDSEIKSCILYQLSQPAVPCI